MHRRAFIKKSTKGSLALYCIPPNLLPPNKTEYSTLELMGKERIPLYGGGINLRKEAHDAFVSMKMAAAQDGFDIKIVSSYRDFYRQKTIWERKYINYTEMDRMEPIDAMEKIIEYSTIPGTSRHHWGTDIDIIDGNAKANGSLLVSENFVEKGPFTPLKNWMDANAKKYNFHLVYTDSYFRRGFKYEPWHYSYAPLSIPMLKQFRKTNILKNLSEETFEGTAHFTRQFLKTYIHNNILDINPSLL